MIYDYSAIFEKVPLGTFLMLESPPSVCEHSMFFLLQFCIAEKNVM